MNFDLMTLDVPACRESFRTLRAEAMAARPQMDSKAFTGHAILAAFSLGEELTPKGFVRGALEVLRDIRAEDAMEEEFFLTRQMEEGL